MLRELQIFADPLITTVPIEPTVCEAKEWLRAFQAWIDEISLLPDAWFCFSECVLALFEAGAFPVFDKLRELQRTTEIDINIGLLAKSAYGFFQQPSRDYRSACSVTDFLGALTISPSTIIDRNHDLAKAKLEHALGIISINSSLNQTTPILATNKAIAVSDISSISIAGSLDVVESSSKDPSATPETTKFHATVSVVHNPADIVASISVRAAFTMGASAIERVVSSLASVQARLCSRFKIFDIFVNNVHELGLANSDAYLAKIVRACVDVVLDDQKKLSGSYNLRQLRDSRDANASQRRREHDKAGAWRLTILDSGIGVRAHYWKWYDKSTKQTVIEFANLLKKTDTENIPESDACNVIITTPRT